MRIAEVRPIAVTLPLEREPMSFFFVRVATHDGHVGYGEACDSYGCSYAGVLATVVDDAFAPLLVDQPLVSAEHHANRLRLWTRRRLGETWIAAQAASAVEIALRDLEAQVAGRSVSAVLGRCRDQVEVYASCGFLEEGDADHHLALIEPLVARGIRKIKLRTGPHWRADLATLASLRAALDPAITLMVDGSECYTLATAQQIARRLADLDVDWFEEPIPQGERIAIEQLAARSPVAIAYGEHLFGRGETADVLARGGLHVLQPDASTAGGIGEARRMAELGAVYGSRVVPHVCAGPISLAANLHLAASVPNVALVEYPPSLFGAWSALAPAAPLGLDHVIDGRLPIPDAAGLGVVLDEAVAAAHPYRAPQRLAGVRATLDRSRDGLPDRFVGDR